MQALFRWPCTSPLVCFGIRLPGGSSCSPSGATCGPGDDVYRVLRPSLVADHARACFAVGVVTGTILSFELGLLWPGPGCRTSATSFGPRVHARGILLLSSRAIFIGIYAYGWDRLLASRRTSCPASLFAGPPGVAGSLFVIAVNGWMNHPSGFTLVNGRAEPTCTRGRRCLPTRCFWSEVRCTCTSPRTSLCGVPARPGPTHGRSCAEGGGALRADGARHHPACPPRRSPAPSPGDRRRLGGAGRGHLPAGEARRPWRGPGEHDAAARPSTVLGWVTTGTRVVWGVQITPACLSLLADHNPNAVVKGPETSCRWPTKPPVNVVAAVVSRRWSASGRLLALIGPRLPCFLRFRAPRPAPPLAVGRSSPPGPLSVVAADRRLDHHPRWAASRGSSTDVMRVVPGGPPAQSAIPVGYGRA